MKITDVTLTLFGWENIPPTAYAAHTGKFSGSSTMGLLEIHTGAAVPRTVEALPHDDGSDHRRL
ncbi:MAG: mandelate racemase [Ramlibacter sp.]|nr:mandelate racemase [Ramlibacter sp.]